jgi:hypothetical protein
MVFFAKVAVMLTVPMMIVLVPASRAFPVARIIPPSIVVRRYPVGSLIMRASVVSVMPPVTAPHWVPVAVHPNKVGTGAHRPDANYARTWRRAYPDSQG